MRDIAKPEARRVAVRAAGLAGGVSSVLDTVHQLGDLQLDPTRAVERSHLLVLWSRLGAWDRAELERLLWEERALFEYSAFIYPVRDLAVHAGRMRAHPADETLGPTRARLVRDWLAANADFAGYVLDELRARGPLRSRELEDRAAVAWRTGGWADEKNLTRMLETLWAQGKILVTRREGGERVWDLAERVLPALAEVEPLDAWDSLRERLRISMRTAGIGRPRSGWQRRALRELAEEGALEEVTIDGSSGWYAHPEALADEGWEPRVTLLSPFDNLIRDRERTQELFDFEFRLEIYVPKAKRRWGYFVLPVLEGDELVGRIDPLFDRKTGVLRVHAVHTEPGRTLELDEPLASLAAFLGAERVEVGEDASV